MALPYRTTGSLRPAFASARLVGITVNLAYAFALVHCQQNCPCHNTLSLRRFQENYTAWDRIPGRPFGKFLGLAEFNAKANKAQKYLIQKSMALDVKRL